MDHLVAATITEKRLDFMALAPCDARDLMADPFFSRARTKHIVPINFRVGAIGDWQRRAVSLAFLQKPNTHFTNSNANCSQCKLQGAAA